jgi:hypothetical protein
MTIMQGGIQLSLFIGPVPVEAPAELVDALSSAQVHTHSGDKPSGFELSFDLPARSPLRTLFLLTGGGAAVPLMRVVLVVRMGGNAEPLIDGMVTNVETLPGDGGVSKLVVKGKDMSVLMDYIDLSGIPYPAMPPAARVLLVLAKYAALGVIPIVIPSIVEDLPIPVERIPQQRGTDYAYVSLLAQLCGYVFYLEPGPVPGTSKAYWGPEIRVGQPQPALSVNMDAITNVEELSFNFDKERKELPIVYFQELLSKAPIALPIPDISPLNPPLGLLPPLPPKIVRLKDTAKMSPLSAMMAGLAYAGQHSDSVFGSGRLDVSRYGRLLKSRQLVGVRGVGVPFDGLYYVKSVTHDIKRGEYKQSFSLARNALISTLPTVPL